MNVACAVLAAGSSTRLGFPKQLLRWFEHRTLVQHAVDCALGSGCPRVAVVVGAYADRVESALADRDVEFVRSPWQLGLAASVQTAVRWADRIHAEALLLTLCDQPYLNTTHLRRLLAASGDGTCLTASRYAGKAGAAPALFPKRYFEALCALRGDQGAGQLLSGNGEVVCVDWPDGEFDIDTKDDIARAAARELRAGPQQNAPLRHTGPGRALP